MSDYENPKLPKGGRGKKAPYETQTVRIPVPCMESVKSIIDNFRNTGNAEIKSDLIGKNDVIKIAQDILDSRIGRTKSAKQSMEKLLQVIYGDDITL